MVFQVLGDGSVGYGQYVDEVVYVELVLVCVEYFVEYVGYVGVEVVGEQVQC